MKRQLWLTAVLALAVGCGPQPPAAPPDVYSPPRHYVCCRASGHITIDGRIDEAAWAAVPWTEDFTDIEGDKKPAPRFRTRAKMLWDDRHLYVAAELEEPHVWATLTEHDSVIFHDNDFELFIDPDGDNHNYAEFEVNALNTGWDLLLKKPYRDGGPADNSWEIPGLKTAVHVDGTLNDPGDLDRGWSVEIALPVGGAGQTVQHAGAAARRRPVAHQLLARRVETRTLRGEICEDPGERPEDNWVWSPQGVDRHAPAGDVGLRAVLERRAGDGGVPARPRRFGQASAHRIYYAQRAFHETHKRYANALDELGLGGFHDETLTGPPALKADADAFQATVEVRLSDGETSRSRIREDSRLWPADEPKP